MRIEGDVVLGHLGTPGEADRGCRFARRIDEHDRPGEWFAVRAAHDDVDGGSLRGYRRDEQKESGGDTHHSGSNGEKCSTPEGRIYRKKTIHPYWNQFECNPRGAS